MDAGLTFCVQPSYIYLYRVSTIRCYYTTLTINIYIVAQLNIALDFGLIRFLQSFCFEISQEKKTNCENDTQNNNIC